METFFLFFFTVIGSVIIGGLAGLVLVTIFNKFLKLYLWKRRPKDDNDMLNGGKEVKLNKKEVKQNDREQFKKYREFEKFRRIAQGKSGTSRKLIAERLAGEIAESGILQSEPDYRDSENEQPVKLNSPSDQRFE